MNDNRNNDDDDDDARIVHKGVCFAHPNEGNYVHRRFSGVFHMFLLFIVVLI